MSDQEMSDEEAPNATPEAFLRLMALLHERERRISNNQELVDHLRSQGSLKTERIIDAFLHVPRVDFIPQEQIRSSFNDSPLPLQRWGFNVSAPHVYAICLEALDPQPGMDLLDIGCGCGHFTALGGFLVGPSGSALGLDIRDDVVEFSRKNTKDCEEKRQLSLNCDFENRNCFLPDLQERKFDRIHSGACCPQNYLKKLIDLLKPGGILVTPSGNELLKIRKREEKELAGKTEKERREAEIEETVLSSVRYGDLILPSKAEIELALFFNQKKKASIIQVSPSTYEADKKAFQNLEREIQESVECNFQRPSPSSDLCFRLNNTRFYVHRSIVGGRCEFFDAQFKSGMKDANAKEIDVIPQSEPSSFQGFLRYLYLDQVDITPENVIDLLELASFYQVKHLLGLCELFLKHGVDVENACEILEIADRHSSLQLKRFCLGFIIDHFDDVKETEGFGKLSRDLLIDVTSQACRLLGNAFHDSKSD